MKWGVDGASEPTEPEMDALLYSGISWVAGYIGGRALNVWSPEVWRVLHEDGMELLPIWVAPLSADDPGREQGIQEGNEALVTMQSLGLTGLVVLDVENGLEPYEYALGFRDAVNNGECALVVYGTNSTLWALRTALNFAWLANWSNPRPEDQPYPADLWQYGTGSRWDYSIADNGFAFAGLSR